MIYYARGTPTGVLTNEDLREGLLSALGKLGMRTRVLAIPPDITRIHSQAGLLTQYSWNYFGDRLTDILPAIGTHSPVSADEMKSMFGDIPQKLFRVHDWRKGLVTLGQVPAAYVESISEGCVHYDIPIQVDPLIASGRHDLILSIGQVVPHEVIGMANYNKNVFIGAGGGEGINKTHFLGAAYGMERIMGRADTPVRAVLNYGSDHFARHLPIVYVLTVVGVGATGVPLVRGLYVGDDIECFHLASELSLRVNFDLLDEPLRKVVVYLDPTEFKSTWLGNKSIYRTRMAIGDGGELIVLAPGVRQFGEDPGIDALIRKYGYIGSQQVLKLVQTSTELQNSLGAAAHLIHGSSEGRFSVTYCPGGLTREEIEHVNFRFAPLAPMTERYNPAKMRNGLNKLPDGEEIFFISNPSLGLWSHKARFFE